MHSPPFVTAVLAVLMWLWAIPFAANVALSVGAWRNHRRSRQLLEDYIRNRTYVLQLTLREDVAGNLTGEVHLRRDDPARARIALVIASDAIANASAEFEASENEQAMEAYRHVP